MKPTAVVIGGGIGGLATAALLGRGGWSVDVLERSAALPAAGTALGMWPSALRALDALGVGAQVRALGRPQTGGAFLRPDGSRIATLDTAGMVRRTGDAVRLLSRPALLRCLYDAVPPGTVRFGEPVEDIRERAAAYDVAIAADGINSPARTALFGPAHRAVYVGATSWRGTVPGGTGAVTETWGEGLRFGITPQEGGRTNWFACAWVPSGLSAPDGEVAELRTRFGHWHAEVRGVLDRIGADGQATVLRHDLYRLAPPLPSYVKGRIALIGDAARAMTPDLGRGACEALVDGVTLARALLTEPTVPAALHSYDTTRRPTTHKLARTARLMNRMAHTRHLTPLRDAALRAALTMGGPPT